MSETKVMMENEASAVPTPGAILEAAAALAQVCDGAHEQDGMGYNGCDSPVAKSILRSKNPTVRQIRALWNILRKYRKQLEARGILYELLVPPPLPAVVPGAPGAPFVPQAVIVKLQWADTQYGRRIVLNFPYSADVVAKVKQCPKRWFDKDGKNSAGIKNAWLIPDEVGHLDNLVGLIRQIVPVIEVELAADLKAAMDAARDLKRKAYAESRAESAELEIPTKVPFRPFQKAGVKWALDRNGRALIADDMGLGKTAQALGFLLVKGVEALPALVIAPATLRGTWVREASKFTDLKCQILTAKSSLKMLRKAGFIANLTPEPDFDVTIMNYDMLSTETSKTWIRMLHKGDSAYAHDNLLLAGRPAVELLMKAMAKRPGLEIENRLNRVRMAIEALGDAARGVKEKRFFRSFVNDIPVEEFMKAGFKTLICDEIHRAKDSATQTTMAVQAISREMENVLGLTGTPILNRPKEAWSQVNIVNPKVFPSFFEFAKRYCNAHQTRFGWDMSGASNLEEMDATLRSTVMIRRMKEQVLKELPPLNRITVPMMLDKMDEYEDDAKNPIKKLALLNKEREEWKAVLATLTDEERKRYITEHAEQASRAQQLNGLMLEEIEEVKQAAVRAKFDDCVKFILELQEAQGKIIVFMVHHEFTDRMVAELQKEKLSVGMIDGRVSMGKRDAIKDAFQEGDTQVLVCGIRAASEGLTLTASHTVVFVELDWNPSRHQQAQSRAHRFGQSSVTTVYYLVGLGTVEEKIARLIDSKAEVTAAATGGTDQTMTEQNIMEAVLEDLLK